MLIRQAVCVVGSGLVYDAYTTKATRKGGFHCVCSFVIPAGFEPTTHSLEGCCSIQLSYGTIDILCDLVAKCTAKVIKN